VLWCWKHGGEFSRNNWGKKVWNGEKFGAVKILGESWLVGGGKWITNFCSVGLPKVWSSPVGFGLENLTKVLTINSL
jgi:hypothetical protein